MDISDIRKLVRLVEQSDIRELKIQDGKFSIYIARNGSAEANAVPSMSIMQPMQQAMMPMQHTTNLVPATQTPTITPDNIADARDKTATNNAVNDAHIVKSQMVGTFYRSSSPDTAPFVSEGDTVKQGDSLCIIEAMKLMNEIPAEYSGVVEKVLVDNASPVEYGQALFIIRPL